MLFKIVIQQNGGYQTGADKQIPIFCIPDKSDLIVDNSKQALYVTFLHILDSLGRFRELGSLDGVIIIHRHNDEYITVVFVPGSLLRSTKECQLGYFMGVPGSPLNFKVIRNSSRKILILV